MGAVEWWDESQMRVLVLASLAIQYFLAFFAVGRKFYIPSWYRFLIWLTFLGGDAVAIYALATLFSRQQKLHYDAAYDSRDLEVFWAPILLIHLGGQLSITAYNLEDNELWKRHLIGAPAQIAVAFFVFYKSWSSSADKMLSVAAVLLFIYGIIKCVLKPLALKSASFNSLASSFKSDKRTPSTNREEELEKYVQDARTFFQQADNNNNPPPALSHKGFSKPGRLFVDYAHPYSVRLADLQSFWILDKKAAYESLKGDLSNMFYLLYTRVGEDREGGRYSWRMVCTSALSLVVGVALFLFHKSQKRSYIGNDITVTFVLLWGTFLVDFTSNVLSVHIRKLDSVFSDNTVPQYSIFAFLLPGEDVIQQSYSSKGIITNLVREHLKDAWKNCIRDAESYRKFSDFRGQWTVQRLRGPSVEIRSSFHEDLLKVLERPFGESIIQWHIATYLCFHNFASSAGNESARSSIIISNYMMYLLLKNPEMLIADGKCGLVGEIVEHLEIILPGEGSTRDADKLAKRISDLYSDEPALFRANYNVNEAMDLYNTLYCLDDREDIWELIKGVWVEMLCFSASRGRGFLHAKALGSGGEYLSTVWLLLARAGMETFQERLHRSGKPRSEEERKKPQSEEERKKHRSGKPRAVTTSRTQIMPPSILDDPSIDFKEAARVIENMDTPSGMLEYEQKMKTLRNEEDTSSEEDAPIITLSEISLDNVIEHSRQTRQAARNLRF